MQDVRGDSDRSRMDRILASFVRRGFEFLLGHEISHPPTSESFRFPAHNHPAVRSNMTLVFVKLSLNSRESVGYSRVVDDTLCLCYAFMHIIF
jgi:hypothetical protein